MAWNQRAGALLRKLRPTTSTTRSAERRRSLLRRSLSSLRHENLEQRMLLAGDVTPTLSFSPTSISENGGASVGTISLSEPADTDIVFDVADIGLFGGPFDLPETVTIPANATSASFDVIAIDDDVEDGDGSGVIEVSNDVIGAATASLFVMDDEMATLSASLSDPAGVLEGEFIFINFELSVERTFDTDIEVLLPFMSDELFFAAGDNDVTIPAGSLTATLAIFGRFDSLVDGDQVSETAIVANGISDTVLLPITTIDADSFELSLSLDADEITEEGTTTGTVSITTPSETDVVVSLVTDDSEANVPAEVIIPALATSADFEIVGVNDGLVDGDQTITITASTDSSDDASVDLTVIDIDTTTLLVGLADDQVNEGESVAGTVSLTTPLAVDTVVSILVDDATETSVSPAEVTILAGETSADFTVEGLNDDLVDGDQLATISVAAGDLSDAASITVTDVDVAEVGLVLADTELSEGETTTGLATLSTPSVSDVVITISSSDASEIGVPAEVTIPAGEVSAEFTATALIDGLVDGDQTASVSVTDGATSASSDVSVIDVDTSTLSLEIDADSISENGGSAAGVVVLSTPVATDTVVTLAVDDDSEASVPAEVVIPAFATSAQLTVTGVDDDLIDGDQLVTVTASSLFGDATNSLAVTDDEEVVIEEPVVGVTFSDGTLEIVGTERNDSIIIVSFGSDLRVFANFGSGDFESLTLALGDVSDIQATLDAGDDRFLVIGRADFSVNVDGGLGNDSLFTAGGDDVITDLSGDNRIFARSGNDTIITGDGNDIVRGGAGNDVIITGAGNDRVFSGSGDDAVATGAGSDLLFAASGRNVLIGGKDSDVLIGRTGGNLLIGGLTDFDNDADALASLVAVWGGDGSIEDRLLTLQLGTGELDGIQLVAGQTVTDDEAVDKILGSFGADPDLFFADTDEVDGDDVLFRIGSGDLLETV